MSWSHTMVLFQYKRTSVLDKSRAFIQLKLQWYLLLLNEEAHAYSHFPTKSSLPRVGMGNPYLFFKEWNNCTWVHFASLEKKKIHSVFISVRWRLFKVFYGDRQTVFKTFKHNSSSIYQWSGLRIGWSGCWLTAFCKTGPLSVKEPFNTKIMVFICLAEIVQKVKSRLLSMQGLLFYLKKQVLHSVTTYLVNIWCFINCISSKKHAQRDDWMRTTHDLFYSPK